MSAIDIIRNLQNAVAGNNKRQTENKLSGYQQPQYRAPLTTPTMKAVGDVSGASVYRSITHGHRRDWDLNRRFGKQHTHHRIRPLPILTTPVKSKAVWRGQPVANYKYGNKTSASSKVGDRGGLFW